MVNLSDTRTPIVNNDSRPLVVPVLARRLFGGIDSYGYCLFVAVPINIHVSFFKLSRKSSSTLYDMNYDFLLRFNR